MTMRLSSSDMWYMVNCCRTLQWRKQCTSLNIFYLLKCAKRIRHKINQIMKSSSIYNKLQHYLIEHVYKYFLH